MGSSVLDPYTDGDDKTDPRTDLKIGHYTSKRNPRKGLRPEGLSYNLGYRAKGSWSLVADHR